MVYDSCGISIIILFFKPQAEFVQLYNYVFKDKSSPNKEINFYFIIAHQN